MSDTKQTTTRKQKAQIRQSDVNLWFLRTRSDTHHPLGHRVYVQPANVLEPTAPVKLTDSYRRLQTGFAPKPFLNYRIVRQLRSPKPVRVDNVSHTTAFVNGLDRIHAEEPLRERSLCAS